jgi:hypothetical protein
MATEICKNVPIARENTLGILEQSKEGLSRKELFRI